MPYIAQGIRESLIEGRVPDKPGDLNFLVTKLIDSYLVRKGLGYAAINDVIGVLECAKLELYRKLAAPYEDKKEIENGPVYNAR